MVGSDDFILGDDGDSCVPGGNFVGMVRPNGPVSAAALSASQPYALSIAEALEATGQTDLKQSDPNFIDKLATAYVAQAAAASADADESLPSFEAVKEALERDRKKSQGNSAAR